MTRNQKSYFFLSICFILLPGIAVSEENKKVPKKNSQDKAKIEKMLKYQSGTVLPFKDIKYSMKIIKPNPNIDSEIVKNTFDPYIDYKLRIINPYTRKEITGKKEQCISFPKTKFLPKGKRYETPIIIPDK